MPRYYLVPGYVPSLTTKELFRLLAPAGSELVTSDFSPYCTPADAVKYTVIPATSAVEEKELLPKLEKLLEISRMAQESKLSADFIASFDFQLYSKSVSFFLPRDVTRTGRITPEALRKSAYSDGVENLALIALETHPQLQLMKVLLSAGVDCSQLARDMCRSAHPNHKLIRYLYLKKDTKVEAHNPSLDSKDSKIVNLQKTRVYLDESLKNFTTGTEEGMLDAKISFLSALKGDYQFVLSYLAKRARVINKHAEQAYGNLPKFIGYCSDIFLEHYNSQYASAESKAKCVEFHDKVTIHLLGSSDSPENSFFLDPTKKAFFDTHAKSLTSSLAETWAKLKAPLASASSGGLDDPDPAADSKEEAKVERKMMSSS